MANAFVVYIDESGDEGFSFRDYPNKGSSDWLVLTAIILRVETDPSIRELAAKIRTAVGLARNQTIHFSDLTHDKRIRIIEEIADSNICISNIVVNKREILHPEIFSSAAFRLYFYSARLLLERISWYCRDSVQKEQNCEAKIIFEHRRRLSYDKLREYFEILRVVQKSDEWLQLLTKDVNIHWPAINIDTIEAAQKHDYAGLQIADCVAGAIRQALEVNAFRNTEHRYVKKIKPKVYKRGNYSSYGMKCFPCAPSIKSQHSYWFYKHYK